MPRSKRSRLLGPQSTRTKTRKEKAKLIDLVRSCLPPKYRQIYVFEYGDIGNQTLKAFREQVKQLPEGGGRLFLGSNKVLQVALGRTPEEAYGPDLDLVATNLRGKRGLLFSNATCSEIRHLFSTFHRSEYAHAGDIASRDVLLPVDEPLEGLPAAAAPKLRELGLPVGVRGGRLFLEMSASEKHFCACSKGDRLSAEQCALLRILGIRMAVARLYLRSYWDAETGKFEEVADQETNLGVK
ncbi:mRNA turnover 4 [Cyanidiococcus yangmingshanensis]|uniref:mRNA turnover 4 n=1 Tax=Cyanidiococcus yangmingshanensis TaxID=2690220 RepID=A0A7J7IBS5_9RHOD|nr:mRNA turnover 4 [Cyanidiococcus yangmingshanensis]